MRRDRLLQVQAGAAAIRRALRWQNGLVVVVLIAAVLVTGHLWPRPPLRDAFPHSTAVYDDSGQLLRLTLASDDQYRLWTPLEAISPQLTQAVLLHEDQWFWWHPGFNLWGLMRGAWVTYVLGGHPQGGSTITMQLARLLYDLHTRSPLGKLHQIALAIKLELLYSKQEILAAYLNYAPYGGNVVGAGTASLIYFDAPASALTLPQALTLALLPQNPSRQLALRKAGDRVLAPGLVRDRNRLYQRWLIGHPDDRDLQPLFAMPLPIRGRDALPFLAPHAVDQLLATARTRGVPLPDRVDMTINLGLQRLVQRQVTAYVRQRRDVGITNAAVLLVDTRTMGIKALLGSADFFDRSIHGQVNGTRAKRSPGSTLKPFIYALGIQQGVLTPATVLRDVPTSFGAYTPENFDGSYLGPVTATQALVRSRNVPAVWVEAHLPGGDLYDFLQQAGVSRLASRRHYGLALVLGGGAVTMQELARMYAVLPNRGMLRPLRLRKSAPQVEGKRLLTAAASFIVTQMLQQNPRSGSALGMQHPGPPVYWKTGTSWAFHDAWTAGGFGPYVLVVWVGNFDSTPNPAFVGVRAAAPLFFRIHDALLAAYPNMPVRARPIPGGVKKVPVCLATGMLPSRWCPQTGMTWFVPGVSPIKVGNVFRPLVIDDGTDLPACLPYDDKATHIEVFEYWTSDLAAVFAQAGLPIDKPPQNPSCAGAGSVSGDPPRITSPLRGSTYTLQPKRRASERIAFIATSDADVHTLYWFVDNTFVGRSAPMRALPWQPQRAGVYRVQVVDDHGRSDQRTLRVGLAW